MVSSCSAGARLILDRGKARSLQTFLGPSRNGRSGGSLLVIGHYLLSFASLKENCCWNGLTTKSFASTRMACFNYPYGSRRSRSLVRSGAPARCCKFGLTLTAPPHNLQIGMKGHAIGLSRLRKTLIDVLDTCQARAHATKL